MIAEPNIRAELAIASGDIARMRTLIANVREAKRELLATDLGLLPLEQYQAELAFEQRECTRLDDAVGIVEVQLDRELEAEEELTLYRDLVGLAANPGDIIGKTGPSTYQLAMPWSDEHKTTMMQAYVAGVVADALPSHTARLGYAIIRTAAPIGPIETHLPPNRTPIIKTSRQR